MERDSFIFYRSFYESVKEIPEEEQLQTYKLIIEYALNGVEIDIKGIPRAIFALVKPQIDANTKRYENGKKGGRKPKQNQNETKSKPNVNDNVNVNVNDNVNKKEQEEKIHFAEFVSMTNAEYEKLVSTYGKELADQCITILDNYKGSSGKKYKSDYRAILNWVIDRAKENKPKETTKKAYQNYEQRDITNFDNFYAN